MDPRNNRPDKFSVAHIRALDGVEQSLAEHLSGVSILASKYASKLGLETAGKLIGLLHDLGKYSEDFQNYLRSATGQINPDEDDFVDAKGMKGKIDHSTAGAQLIWNELSKQGVDEKYIGQFLAVCIASHHSGLIDCLSASPGKPVMDRFSARMEKADELVHLEEVQAKMDAAVYSQYKQLVCTPALTGNLISKLVEINKKDRGSLTTRCFKQGLLLRFLFSCLIDADRVDTADFENPVVAKARQHSDYPIFDTLIERLNDKLASFDTRESLGNLGVNQLRRDISEQCLHKSESEKGIFTLSVPTGGGKTLASLRFALHHAKKHELERIVYVIPFTSIIDQNADETRKILEPVGSGDQGKVVLEHHSNLTPKDQSWKSKILAENWDAPVVYTTMVQFLESLFGSGTRGARRMHQLSKSVIIFDEIQTLPVNCVHLFNNAIHFLADHCDSSVVLCTATQPLLNEVDPKKGRIELTPESEMMTSVEKLFQDLNRVEVVDRQKKEGWAFSEISDLAMQEVEEYGSCLVVVNTKKSARILFEQCTLKGTPHLFHLSTSMCPAHRKTVLRKVRELLDKNEAVLCISTQLIEAGVDVDFGAVIRFTAGLDSIAQAAGRCNRNGSLKNPDGSLRKGRVSIVNPADEELGQLTDILKGIEKTHAVLEEFKGNPGHFDNGNLIGPTAMATYYRYYFFDRQSEMDYPVDHIGWSDSLLNLLSTNSTLTGDYKRVNQAKPAIAFRQSFMTANRAFKSIDAPTRGILVPYGERGDEIIGELCAAYEPDKQYALLREAQQYSVNVYDNLLSKLAEEDAIHRVQEDIDIFYLKNRKYYNRHFGLTDTPTEEVDNYHVI